MAGEMRGFGRLDKTVLLFRKLEGHPKVVSLTFFGHS